MNATLSQRSVGRVRQTLFAVALLGLGLFPSSFSWGQSNEMPRLELGIDGHVKLGHWVPLTIRDTPAAATKFEVTCRDSDDMSTTYRGALIRNEAVPGQTQAWFRLGRQRGNVDLVLKDDEDQVIYEASTSVNDEDVEISKSTRQAVLLINRDDSIAKQLSKGSIRLNDEPLLVVAPESMQALPTDARLLESIDVMMISVSGNDKASRLTAKQATAIDLWVQNGGHLIVSSGSDGVPFFASDQPGAVFAPGTIDASTELTTSSRIEFFSNSRERLIANDGRPLDAIKVTPRDGKTLLAQDGSPVVIQQAKGFGLETFVAMDIDSERMRAWPGYLSFIGRILKPNPDGFTAPGDDKRKSRASFHGYRDITGQLRVPLGQFSRVQFISFTLIAILIALYILCIGPGDYFFLKKVIGKMEYTWITFTLITLAFCGIAYWGTQATKPSTMQINQVEIIDVDLKGNRARSTNWINVFSPNSGRIDIGLADVNPTGEATPFNPTHSRLSWQGLPGKSLGGMESTTVAGVGHRPYRHVADGSETNTALSLEEVPFQVSSSKSLLLQWTAPNEFQFRNGLTYDGLLRGTITNNLDVRLENCRLMFEEWVFLFDRPIEPGETVDIRAEAKDKNLKSYMNRRVNKKGKGTNAAWNPSDTNVAKIIGMMMFFEAGGGQSYTSLTNDYQSFTDMSALLDLNRAILVGEMMEKGGTSISIDGKTANQGYDTKRTFLRVVFPVQKTDSRTRRRSGQN